MLAAIVAAALCVSSCSPPAPVGSGRWLLSGLRRIADEGALFEPARVEEILRLQLSASREETVKQPPDCLGRHGLRSEVVTRHSSSPPWLTSTAEGVRNMPYPAAFINSSGVSGDHPMFAYEEIDTKSCNGMYDLENTGRANLRLYDLPAFACFRRDDLERKLSTEHNFATDGVDFETYRGAVNDSFGTNLRFMFRAGAPCALSVQLEQRTNRSYRYSRAYWNWRACVDAENGRYCAANSAPTQTDWDAINAMEDSSIKACGTMTSFYEREPLTGLPPRASPRIYYTGRCPGM